MEGKPTDAKVDKDAIGIFEAGLSLAKQKKSKEAARQSLMEIGIITADGRLAEHYKPKTPVKKSAAVRADRKTPKAPGKVET